MNSGRGEKELVKGKGEENDREPFPPRTGEVITGQAGRWASDRGEAWAGVC